MKFSTARIQTSAPVGIGARRARGFSMVEVLVALIVLAIGLLGLAMLQVKASQFGRGAFSRTQATVLAYDLMDRIRANKAGSDAGAYCITGVASPCTTSAPPATPETCATGCTTPSQLAAYHVTQWYQLLNSTLVAAAANSQYTREQIPVGTEIVSKYVITINWRDHDMDMSQSWEFYI